MDMPSSKPDGFNRIDAAHQLSADDVAASAIEAPSSSLVAAAAGVSEDLHDEQTQLQGHQLMIELTRRQREIDRRESQFNAFLATLDSDARSQRIKQREREDELTTRERELSARLAEFTQREAELRDAEELGNTRHSDDAQLRRLQQELEEKRICLDAQENALCFRWQKMQSQSEAAMQLVRHLMRSVERRREAVEQRANQQGGSTAGNPNLSELSKLAAELEKQSQALSEGRSELAAEREKLSTERQQLRNEREEWSTFRTREETRFKQQRSMDRAEQTQRQEALDCRSEELSKRQATLEQMQVTVTDTHREALELRLATEQLWAQLGKEVSPRELAETLGELRAKLSEHYRTAEDALELQRDELQEMASRLDDQQQCIRDDRLQLQQWVERRNEEIEFQAARLVAREQELHSQQSQLALTREKWEQQRNEYEDEIRRLQAKLRQERAAA